MALKKLASVDDINFSLTVGGERLVPAVVQDARSGEVLMLAYMNWESLEKSLASGETWFYSRSRRQLWHKGETSGHTQAIKSLYYDCDADAVLVLVEPQGPACHEGDWSCFHHPLAAAATDGVDINGAHGRDDTGERGGASDANDGPKAKEAGGAKEADGAKTAGSAEGAPGVGAATGATGLAAMFDLLLKVIAQRQEERPEGSYTAYLFNSGQDKILKKVGEETSEVIIASKNQSHDELVYEVSDLLYHLLVLLTYHQIPLADITRELRRRHQ